MISTPFVLAILGIPGLGTPELVIILVIVLVLFGPKRLPQLGKSLGKTMKAIREGAEGKLGDGEEEPEAPVVKAQPKTEEPAEKHSDNPESK